MTNDDVLRRLRYALHLPDHKVIELIARTGMLVDEDLLQRVFALEDEPDAVECSDDLLNAFLDGLILDRRGPPRPGTKPRPLVPLTNNEVLKKLRIALELRDTDLMELLESQGHPMSKSEVAALFRNPDHRSFRPCGDQVLRYLIAGLTQRLRGQ